MKPTKTLLLILFASIWLHGCSLWIGHVPRKDQGNIIKQEELQNLKVGLTALEIRQLFGPPLAQPQGSRNPWIYVFTSNHAEVYAQRVHQLHIYFDDAGKVTSWQEKADAADIQYNFEP